MSWALAICELYNPRIHGQSDNMSSQYLIYDIISKDSFYSNEYISSINLLKNAYYDYIFYQGTQRYTGLVIRNYHNIINDANYITLNIVKYYELSSGHCVACIKTFWLKLLQRKWKRYYAKTQHIIKIMKNPHNLLQYQLTGKLKTNINYTTQ